MPTRLIIRVRLNTKEPLKRALSQARNGEDLIIPFRQGERSAVREAFTTYFAPLFEAGKQEGKQLLLELEETFGEDNDQLLLSGQPYDSASFLRELL